MHPQKSPVSLPNLEVPPKAQRRHFTAEYKRRIVEVADAAKEPGSVPPCARVVVASADHTGGGERQTGTG
jgi:hypothetical protein